MLCKRMEKKAYGHVMSFEHGVGREVNGMGDFILRVLGVTIE